MAFNQTFSSVPIIHEDTHILIANKPSGMLSHPSKHRQQANLIDHFKKKHPRIDFKPVHRLDRKTSGIIILAKNAQAARFYGHVFKNRVIEKTYLAKVHGRMQKQKGKLDNFLSPHPKSKVNVKLCVSSRGQKAITFYKTIAANHQHSYIELQPKTGRRHQLRVHMAHLKHPIVGDPLYDLGDTYYLNMIASNEVSPPMHLHAWKIKLPMLNNKTEVFSTDYPEFWDIQAPTSQES